jgi:ferrous iron transport protein B
VVDTPGTNGFAPSGEDEAVTRDILLAEPAAPILLVVDAKNLRRGLALALHLLEMGRTFAVVLNMADEARARGIEIDAEALARLLGVPVFPAVAVDGLGVGRILEFAGSPAPPRPPAAGVLPVYPAAADRAIRAVAAAREASPAASGLAALVLADRMLADGSGRSGAGETAVPREMLAAAERERRRFGEGDGGGVAAILAAARLRAADRIVDRVERLHADRAGDDARVSVVPTRGSAAPRIAWRAAVGLGIGWLAAEPVRLFLRPAAAIVWAAAAAVGAAAFVALTAAGRRRERALADAFGRAAVHPLWGLPLLVVVLYACYRFVGVFGAGTLVGWLEDDLFGRVVNPWLRDALGGVPWRLVRDGLVGPFGLLTMALTYAVAIVLPIVGTFFLAFAVLEDSGYLPRLSVMLDRLFRLVGLNGRAVLPMILGLGCGTMATLTTRILETRKERIVATFLLALGIPCSAQLGVVLAMLARVGFVLAFVWAAAVLLTMLAAGAIAARVVPGSRSDFLLEIPPIRRPQFRNVALKTGARLGWYVREAVPLFALGTFVLFVLHESGALAWLHRAGEPVVTGLLGLPREASEAFLVGFLRRDFGATRLFEMASSGALDGAQTVVAMVTVTLFVPCIANVFMIWKERGTRAAAVTVAAVFATAFLVGGLVRAVLALGGPG